MTARSEVICMARDTLTTAALGWDLLAIKRPGLSRDLVEWISTLAKLEALKPKAVVAGHKVPGNDDDPRIIAETRQYLRDFSRLNAATSTARQLDDAMLEIFPDRANPGSLWGAANAAKKQP